MRLSKLYPMPASGPARGSVSILFMVMVVPFLLIMLVIGIEVSQFWGLREDVQRIADAEIRLGLARGFAPDYVSNRVRENANALRPYISLEGVTTTTTAQSGEVVVRATYRGVLAELVGGLTGAGSSGVPFDLSSIVRRARTGALVVLDRAIGVGAGPCDDDGLRQRSAFVGRLVQDLRSIGIAQVQVGVFPGIEHEVDILSSLEGGDLIPRCDAFDTTVPYQVSSIAGIEQVSLLDPLSIAYRTVDGVLKMGPSESLEQRALIMVAPPIEERTPAISATFALLEAQAQQQLEKYSAVGIVAGGNIEQDFFAVKSESGRARYLHVSEDELKGRDLKMALVQHLQGRIFTAR